MAKDKVRVPPDSGEEGIVVLVDMKDNDSLYWIFWPSEHFPGKHYMIGWPMRLHEHPKHLVQSA